MGLFSRRGKNKQNEATVQTPPASLGEFAKSDAPVGQAFTMAPSNQINIGATISAVGTLMKTAQLMHKQGNVIDLRGTGAREQIMQIMQQNGMAAGAAGAVPGGTPQAYDPAAMQQMQAQIMDVMKQHGVDIEQLQHNAQMAAGIQVTPQADGSYQVAQIGDPDHTIGSLGDATGDLQAPPPPAPDGN